MNHARLFSITVFAIAGLYGLIGFYFLPMANFNGDLTRMGLLPESLFGWTKPQPAIDKALMQQASWKTADVLVIGDSFSGSHVWQTELIRHGLRVHTESWGAMQNICEDFTSWLQAQGFKGKYVIIEAIERNVHEGFENSVACHKMAYQLYIGFTGQSLSPPITSLNLENNKYSGRLSIGLETWFNSLRYKRLSSNPGFKSWQTGNETMVSRLADGCDLFSHPACRDALFLTLDKAQDLGAETLNNLLTLNKRVTGFDVIWAIVPNKSTTYLYPDKRFWDQADKLGVNSVNLLQVMRQAVTDHVVDLYEGNNTHLSTTGYLLMGKAIYQQMQR
jgi:hypothetical protein